RNFIRPRTAPPVPMPSSLRRSKVFRQRLNSQRLRKRKHSSPRLRYEGQRRPRGDEHGAALMRSGKVQQARELLAPVYRWFTGGLAPRDHGAALDRLIGAGLLFRQGVPPEAAYLFKHALVRDAAYGTLLREPRRALHARIAETLETHF